MDLCSTAIGTKSYTGKTTQGGSRENPEKLAPEIIRLTTPEMPTELYLFRYCAGPRLDYISRTLSLPYGATLGREADSISLPELEQLRGWFLAEGGDSLKPKMTPSRC